MTKTIVIGGTQSGSGKTLISLALMAAFTHRGLTVQPFKCGPDFIDPGLHKAVTGNTSINLDGWMLCKNVCIESYQKALADKKPDIAIIEGVMGLFDGASGSSDAGSTAEIAKWLNAPILLVIDGRSMARSFAAVAHGFTTLDSELNFAGCIANRVGSENHTSLIHEAMRTYCPTVPVIGYMPRNDDITLPSRHLGLLTAEEGVLNANMVGKLVDWAEQNIDLDNVLSELPQQLASTTITNTANTKNTVRIAVARDAAFCFCYSDNLRLLKENGAKIVPFSPLEDQELPKNIDGIYLPGGYPELYAERLSLNASMRSAIRAYSNSGKPVYAECGGFMYLTQSIAAEAAAYPMCGVFDLHCTMGKKRNALGYREITTTADSILGTKGTVARGHEFHYSFAEEKKMYTSLYAVTDRKGNSTSTSGYTTANTVGSYVHLHFASQPSVAKAFVDACLQTRNFHD